MYIIQDWAGNYTFSKLKFRSFGDYGPTFKTLDDAEEYLSNYLDDSYDEMRQEYEIVIIRRYTCKL